MLIELSHSFLLCHPPPTNPPSFRSSARTSLLMSMDHAYRFFGCCISYTVLYIPMAILLKMYVCMYLFIYF